MTVLATDNFNRADAANLGANWTTGSGSSGTLPIVSNQVGKPAGGIDWAYNNTVTWPANQNAQLTLATVCNTTDEGLGPALRITGTSTLYLSQFNTAETRLYKCVGGVFTQLGSDGPPGATSDIAYAEVQGTTLIVKKNGTTIIGPITDSAIATGNAGIWETAGGSAATSGDDWAGGDFSVASAPPALLSTAMRPGAHGLRGKVAMAMRAVRLPTSITQGTASTIGSGDGASLSPSTASGAGVAILSAAGGSIGSSGGAFGVGVAIIAGAGSSSSQAILSALSSAIIAGDGRALAAAMAAAAPMAIAAGAGASLGAAAPIGAPLAIASGAGSSISMAAAIAAGASTVSGVGWSMAASLVAGVGLAQVPGVFGVSLAGSLAVGVGMAIAAGDGRSIGAGASLGAGASIAAGTGTASSSAASAGVGASIAAGAGTTLSFSLAYGGSTFVVLGPRPFGVIARGTNTSVDKRGGVNSVTARGTNTTVTSR